MTSPLQQMVEATLAEMRKEGVYQPLRSISGGRFPRVIMDERPVLILGSNNYLGLAEDEQVKAAATEALKRYGCGSATGRTICGTLDLHLELERRLAALNGFGAALLYNSAYMANVGLVSALLRDGDLIYSDELNHASIIDGCRLSRAKTEIYPHSNLARLEERLAAAPRDALKLIITDGVFSMEGDIARLPELVELKRRYGAVLVVDDAHAIGVLGPTGAGSIEYYGLAGEVDIQIGTLGKALGGALGGFVAASREVIDYLAHRSRNFVFTNPVPAAVAAASLKVLDLMAQDSSLRDRLRQNASRLRTGLKQCGFTVADGNTPIIPVIVGDSTLAYDFSRRLFDLGLFVQAFAYPVVPKGAARLRCIVSAAHLPSDIDEAIALFAQAGRELGVLDRGA